MASSSVSRTRWRHIDTGPLEDLPRSFFRETNLPMSFEPQVSESQGYAIWTHPSLNLKGVRAFGLLASATPGKMSEDAPPLFGLAFNQEMVRVVASVFDGMGGAGSKLIPLNEKYSVTNAYLASRLGRQVLEELVWSQDYLLDVPPGVVAEILSQEFLLMSGELPDKGESRIRGKVDKTLPTTIATVMCDKSGPNTWRVRAQWAGDSRAYLLTPTLGLQQITSDDVEESDPMFQLGADHKLNNVVSASEPFKINERIIEVNSHSLLLVATDGLFHYLPTPGTLEFILLDAMKTSETETAKSLVGLSRLISQDDVSLVVVALGFDQFSEIPLAFRRRKALLESLGYESLLAMNPGEEGTVSLALKIWQAERESYMGIIDNYG